MTPTLAGYRSASAAIRSAPEGPARDALRQAAQRVRRTIYEDCAGQTLARRLDPARNADDESMLWSWFNHFNVYWLKDLVGAALPSYLDDAIRPHLHGRFRDLLLAVITHPAMLVYLDNFRNIKDPSQREPCTRTAGASHAWRRRRLHPGRRAADCPSSDRFRPAAVETGALAAPHRCAGSRARRVPVRPSPQRCPRYCEAACASQTRL
jgi:hypothetical protein